MKRYRHPRRPRAGGPRPADLFRAPAPDFYRLPDLTIRGGPAGTGFHAGKDLPGSWPNPGNIVWRRTADRITGRV